MRRPNFAASLGRRAGGASILLLLATSCAITTLEHARKQEDTAIAWVRQEAVPLRTATPTDADEDIAAARDMFGDASVVGLGEATHGTREFFQLKHRLLRMLVEEQGFTVFAIEAHFTAALAVNDYVLEGKGDAVQALAGLEYWTWYTEEVLELIEWMRSYNETVEPERRVRFMGCDMADGELPAEYVLEYLRNVDPDVAREVEPQLARDLSTVSVWFGAYAYKHSSSRNRKQWLRERDAWSTAYPGVEARAEALAERLQTFLAPLPQQQLPDGLDFEGLWVGTYYPGPVLQTNEGETTVQLISRHWIITNADGDVEEVRGPGVVGAQPVLEPGQSFEYTSACPLPTAFGTMHGTYQMVTKDGEPFDAEIAPFSLSMPYAVN